MFPLKDSLGLRSVPWVTLIIVAINIAVWVVQVTGAPGAPHSAPAPVLSQQGLSGRDQNVVEWGATPRRISEPGRQCYPVEHGSSVEDRCGTEAQIEKLGIHPAPWAATVLSAAFMHDPSFPGGLLHIGGNMIFLLVLGRGVEAAMGRGRFALFYLLSAIVSILVQSFVFPDSSIPSVGASGAVFAVAGAWVMLYTRARVLWLVPAPPLFTVFDLPGWIVLLALTAQNVLTALLSLGGDLGGGVAVFAHVGGFLFGVATVRLFAAGRRGWRPVRPVPVT